MPVTGFRLTEFPGFAVRYDPDSKPFFETTLLNDLRLIASKSIGRKLLNAIALANPRARAAIASSSPEAREVVFEERTNVVVIPTSVEYTQTGYKMAFPGVGVQKELTNSAHPYHNLSGRPFHGLGGSSAEAVDVMAAGDGTGSCSIVRYTNAQMMTRKGEASFSFIALAHELIHSLHHVTGTRREHDEEAWTTGIAGYGNDQMTENAFRRTFQLPLRERY